jgi:transposase-like protein
MLNKALDTASPLASRVPQVSRTRLQNAKNFCPSSAFYSRQDEALTITLFVEGMMRERGREAGRSTVFRRVRRYAPEINKRVRRPTKMGGASYLVDETHMP